MNLLRITSLLTIFLLPLAILAGGAPPASAQDSDEHLGAAGRLAAWQDHVRLAETSRFAELPWERLGPKFAGGRIESIACPPGDLATIYAGVGAGGIWKSTNGGLTWTPIFETESTFAIGDLAIAPSDPEILWVGTGECHLSGTSYPGNGVFKSVDGGATWRNMGLHETAHIGSVAIDPVNPDVVYVASMGRNGPGGDRGVYKTDDGGQTFRRVLSDADTVAFVDLVIDPFDRRRLFASAWDRSGGNGSGVFRSDDSGETWQRLAGGLPEQDVDRVAIDLARSQEGVLYALLADRSSPALARRGNASLLFRSSDHGETWTRTHEGYVPTYVGWDFCDVRVAPDDADRVYVGGLRLIVSNDGGATFEGEGGFAVNDDPAEVFRIHPHTAIGLHLDVHDVWVDPVHPQRILLGNDGGLFSSVDRGRTWLHLNSLPIAEFYRIHLDDQSPFRIWGGTQDNASFVGPSSARDVEGVADEWMQVFLDPWGGGDGFSTFPDPNDPEITYYTQQNGDLKRSRLGRSDPEKSIRPSARLFRSRLQFAWDTPFFASVHPGDTVLYCAAQRVLRSDDRGDAWRSISPNFGDEGLVVLSESPIDAARLACGERAGKVHLTLDGGDSWQEAGEGLPDRALRDIELSHHHADVVYVVLSGKDWADCSAYLFRSNDFGRTWQAIVGNLPAESINVVEEDPTIPGLLYVGTDLGVFVSLDDGATWHSLCSTLPTAPVVDLAVHARDGKLVAATHGLSLFLLDVGPIREAARADAGGGSPTDGID